MFLLNLWNRLSWAQRISLAAAALAVTGGITALNHWNQERDFKPLFSGFAAEDGGALTAKLRELGIDYRLSVDGSSILVPSERVAEARLQLASAGLPKSGRIGFELFDKAAFGASEFTEQVNYHRAIEGELERSVMSLHEVEQARVHITLAKESLYTEQRQPAKASVLVKLRHAAALSPQNVAAICQMTASAVPGLAPEQVSLVDTAGNVLNRPRATGASEEEQVSEAANEFRKSVQRDVQNTVIQTLEPLLGADHFRVGVSADVDLTSGDQSEETYDPQKSVVASSQTTSEGPGLISASGVPGTASNLPNPESKPSTQPGSFTRRSENLTYQTTRVVKHTRLPQGTIKRLSIAVLADHTLRWEGSRRMVEPPPPEKLKVIRELVTAATGLDSERGDQLVVEAFPFEATLTAEPLTDTEAGPETVAPRSNLPAWLDRLVRQKNFALLAGAGGAAVVALLVGLVVFVMRGNKAKVKVEAAAAIEAAASKDPAASPQDIEKQIEARMAEQAAQKARQETEALMQLQLPEVATRKTEVLIKHIAAEAKKDPTVMAQVVRSWLRGDNRR